MPKIIIDQYTNRTDLTSQEKWRLRNPEKCKSQQRMWREINSDKVDAYNEKQRKRLELIKSDKLKKSAVIYATGSNTLGKSIRREILNLHSRGKSIGDIVVWTRTPCSIVQRVIEESKTTPTINL